MASGHLNQWSNPSQVQWNDVCNIKHMLHSINLKRKECRFIQVSNYRALEKCGKLPESNIINEKEIFHVHKESASFGHGAA